MSSLDPKSISNPSNIPGVVFRYFVLFVISMICFGPYFAYDVSFGCCILAIYFIFRLKNEKIATQLNTRRLRMNIRRYQNIVDSKYCTINAKGELY
jgi:hypothetical protein